MLIEEEEVPLLRAPLRKETKYGVDGESTLLHLLMAEPQEDILDYLLSVVGREEVNAYNVRKINCLHALMRSSNSGGVQL